MRAARTSRLAYIDWMRGLACVLMFQTHCYDSWLSGDARKTTFFCGRSSAEPAFTFISFPRGGLGRADHGQIPGEGLTGEHNCAQDDPPRRRNSRPGTAVPFARIRDRVGMGAVE